MSERQEANSESLIRIWRELSPYAKIIAIITILTNVLSLSSIAGQIVTWKVITHPLGIVSSYDCLADRVIGAGSSEAFSVDDGAQGGVGLS